MNARGGGSDPEDARAWDIGHIEAKMWKLPDFLPVGGGRFGRGPEANVP